MSWIKSDHVVVPFRSFKILFKDFADFDLFSLGPVKPSFHCCQKHFGHDGIGRKDRIIVK